MQQTLRTTPFFPRARFVLLLFLFGAACTFAQQVLGPDEMRVTTRPYVTEQQSLHVQSTEVQVSVVVRDSHGHAVPGLKATDFELFDQNKPRKISGFLEIHAETQIPVESSSPAVASAAKMAVAPSPIRFVALFFDDLNSEPGDFRRGQIAAEHFINQDMAPGDRVAIFSNSGDGPEDFSSDKPKIIAAIEKLHGHPRVPERGLEDCPRMDGYEAYLISNEIDHDALAALAREAAACYHSPFEVAKNMVRAQAEQTWSFVQMTSQNTLARLQAAIAALANTPGQRTLVVASSGFLTQTLEHEKDIIITQALRASVVINALDDRGLYTVDNGGPLAGLNPDSEQSTSTAIIFQHTMEMEKEIFLTAPLDELADSTGGRFFHNNNDLGLAYREMAGAPQLTYTLTFAPDSDANDGRYHRLKVKLASGTHYAVQARAGYFAPVKNKKTTTVLSTQQKLDKEVAASNAAEGVPLVLTASEGKLPSGANVLWVDVHVDIHPLRFLQEKDRHVQQFMIISALFDSQGKVASATQSDVLLALRDGSLEKLSATGFNAKLYLQAPPGNYNLREVVYEDVDGKLNASTRNVQIH